MAEEKLPNDQAAELIQRYTARAENLLAEKAQIEEDLSELFKEVKNRGLDVKVFKKVLARRAKDVSDFHEEREIEDLYFNAASKVA